MSPRAAVLAVLLSAGLAALAAPAASATERPIWFYAKPCSDGHLSEKIDVPPAGAQWRLRLEVHHVPGSFGTMQLRSLSDPDRDVIWEFTQPWSWIFGHYKIDSPVLPVGEYRFDYWANNRAQAWTFCHYDLTLYNSAHTR